MFANNLEKKSCLMPVEEDLLARIADDDLSAFWEIWLQHKDYLYYHCLKWLGNQIDAQEVLSCAMLRAWEKLPLYVSLITNVRAWLTRLTYNLCIDFHRNRKKTLHSTDNLESIHVSDSYSGVSTSETPEDAMMRHELSTVLAQLISNLPSHLQSPIVLRFCEHKPYAEIAGMINISEVTVRKRIQKARVLLRHKLNQYLSGSECFVLAAGEGNNIPLMMETYRHKTAEHEMQREPSFKSESDDILYQLSTVKLETISGRYFPLSCSAGWY